MPLVHRQGPLVVFSAGLETPQILPPGARPDPGVRWLRKPLESGMGFDIEPWEGIVPDDPQTIVYARRDGTLPDTTDWLAKGRRDIPHAGEPIHASFPICTVTAVARDQQQCYAQLLAEADELLKMVYE